MNRWRWGVALGLVSAVSGCGAIRITRGQAPPSPISTVAVLEFQSENASHAAGAADGCLEGVLEAGYRAVERQRVAAMMQEREETRSGEMGAEFYRQLGEMLGADAFVIGSVQQRGFGNPGGVVVRLVSAQTGDVVLMGSQDGEAGGPTASDKGRTACRTLLQAL